MKKGKVRLTRPLQSGVVFINDRREKLDKKTKKPLMGKDKKPLLEVFRHMLRKDMSPSVVMVATPVYECDSDGEWLDKAGKVTDDPKKRVQCVRKGKKVFEQKPKRDKAGKKVLKPAKSFEVNDLDFVMSEHPHILEVC